MLLLLICSGILFYFLINERLALRDMLKLRGSFEERYSGDCHRGTYLAGVWFPDKTRVGWWKNGYPAYFGKVINAMNILSLRVRIDREDVDLYQDDVMRFERVLDMQRGVLSREFVIRREKGTVKVFF